MTDGNRLAYEALLRKVDVLYGRYEAGRREPFNLFSVLRKPSDEEHLHSKFLAALLNWKSPEDGVRENLYDFVEQVVAPAVEAEREAPETSEQQADHREPEGSRDKAPPLRAPAESPDRSEAEVGESDAHRAFRRAEFSFSLDGARVEREKHHIDLLIKNAAGQAIVIENKIWAADQWQQLQGYFQRVVEWGLEPTLVYLTPYGHEPSDHSRGGHEVVLLSYKWHLIPWLRRCQERACDEPALRESVAQYIALIRTLCGDSGREFMTEVKKILREGNNLILADELGNAVTAVWLDLLLDYWNGVRDEVESAIGVRDDRQLRDMLVRFLQGQGRGASNHFHYAWPLSDWPSASLKIEARRHEGFFYGVCCHRDGHEEEYERLKSRLRSSEYGHADPWWPGRKFFYPGSVWRPSADALTALRDTKKRDEVVRDLKQLWKTLREPGPPT